MGVMLTGQTNRALLYNLAKIDLEISALTRAGIEALAVNATPDSASIALRWDDFCRWLPIRHARKTVLSTTVRFAARVRGVEYSTFRARLPGESAGVSEVTL